MIFKVELTKVVSLLQVVHHSEKNKKREKPWENLEQSWILNFSKTLTQSSRTMIKISFKALKKKDLNQVIHLQINSGFRPILKTYWIYNLKKRRKIRSTLKHARRSLMIIKRHSWCSSRPRTMFSRQDWKYKSQLCKLKIRLTTIKELWKKYIRISIRLFKKNLRKTFWINLIIMIAWMKVMKEI